MRFRGSEHVCRRARGEASAVAAKRAAPSLPDLIALPHFDADPARPERTVHPQAAD